MVDIYRHFKEIFQAILQQIADENNITLPQQFFTIEATKEKLHGDLACNAAMVFSKNFTQIEALNNPRKLANKIIEKCLSDKNWSHDIAKIEVAGPGFINIFLKHDILYRVIFSLLTEKKFTFPNLGNGVKVNLEYASPNPTGPIHVGHTRGSIYGDVLANLLQKCGYDVLREYYINDAGAQIVTLLKSAYLRYLQALGQNVEITEGLYPGEYLIEIGVKLKEKFGDNLIKKSQEEALAEIRNFVVDKMVELIKSDLLALGIKHDSYFSEKKNLHDTKKIDEAINILRQKDLIYEGKLELPKTEKGVGAKNIELPEGYDEKDQTLFRSTKFGDDQDRVVKKHDGSLTYFAADLAYVKNKFERGATIFIMPLGYDHAGYVKRLTAAVEALTDGKAQLKIILCQMVKFVKDGEPLKMSKRAGNFITAREVIDEVGADVLRFIMLTRKNDAHFDFDLTKVIEQSKDNPIFYVQYAYARCSSVLRKLKAETDWQNFITKEPNLDILKNLTDEAEIDLIKKIAAFPKLIELAAINFEPHRIAFYLQELAADFHALWNKGSENIDLKFIISNNSDVTQARIYMLRVLMLIIATALEIFNVKPIEEMR